MQMATERYRLCEELIRLQFFDCPAAFAEHVGKHFASNGEPWRSVFAADLCERLRRVSLDDPQAPELADLYDKVVEHLRDGIGFAERRPVYIRLFQDRGGGRQLTFFFLAEAGYLIIARDGLVRSAYFTSPHPATSAYNRFRGAWDDVRTRAAKVEYDEDNKERVRQSGVRHVSEKNWQICPNPHSRRLGPHGEVP